MTTNRKSKSSSVGPLFRKILDFSDRVVVNGLREEARSQASKIVDDVAEEMVIQELGPKEWSKMKDAEREVWRSRATTAMQVLFSKFKGAVGGRR